MGINISIGRDTETIEDLRDQLAICRWREQQAAGIPDVPLAAAAARWNEDDLNA